MATIDVGGSPVRYDREGAGLPVVLLHGGGTDSAGASWTPVWGLLTGHAELIAPDLPGYGASPLGRTAPTVSGYAEWLAMALDAWQVRRCVLVGLSLGAAVAVRAALDLPQRVAGLLLCGPYGIDPHLPGGHLGWAAVHTPGLDALGWVVLRHSRAAVRSTLRTLLRREGSVTEDLVEQMRRLVREPRAGEAWRAFQRHEVCWAGPRTVFGAELGSIRCPTVLMAGEHDLVPPAVVRAAAGWIPGGRFVEVPGAGHWLPRDAPAEVAAELVGLIASARG